MFPIVVAAAAVTAAEPVNLLSWFSDVQWEMLVSRKYGHAVEFIRVTVSPEGAPLNCTVEATSGVPALDKLTCEAVIKHGSFRPARLPDGRPTYGVYRQSVVWADLPAFEYTKPVDIEIQVDRLPNGLKNPVSFALEFMVDAAGKRSSCQPVSKRMHKDLATIACQQILNAYPAPPAIGSAGDPVESIQTAFVSFVEP